MLSPYYMNLYGPYGSAGEYPTLEALLAHCDRLGIYQTAAVCMEQPFLPSNRQLLADLERVPGAAGRVIPVFRACPFDRIQKGAAEELEEQLSRFPAAGLLLEPGKYDFRLCMAESLLRRLLKYRPVIFLSWKEIAKCPYELQTLAERLPQLNFVVQQVMWNSLQPVYAMMENCPNIYMDNAWLHAKDGLKVFFRLFGPSRLLFSLGLRSNYGAAFGALNFAELPQELKDRIAWDNAAALFPEAGSAWLYQNRRHLDDTVNNRFWRLFREEKPLDIPVVDAHSHICDLDYSWLPAYEGEKRAAEDMLRMMDRLGIDIAVSSNTEPVRTDVLQPNSNISEATKEHRDRFRGYLHYRPLAQELFTEEYLDEMLQGGYFLGLKSLPEYEKTFIDSESYRPMFEYAEKHSLPILLHCWKSSKLDFGGPLRCGEAAKKYPHAKIILGHSGGRERGRMECHQMADSGEYGNIYYEFCGSFPCGISWSESLKHIDYRRVLFGTDTRYHDPAWEMARLLTDELTEEQLTAVLGGNALRILGLKPGEK